MCFYIYIDRVFLQTKLKEVKMSKTLKDFVDTNEPKVLLLYFVSKSGHLHYLRCNKRRKEKSPIMLEDSVCETEILRTDEFKGVLLLQVPREVVSQIKNKNRDAVVIDREFPLAVWKRRKKRAICSLPETQMARCLLIYIISKPS